MRVLRGCGRLLLREGLRITAWITYPPTRVVFAAFLFLFWFVPAFLGIYYLSADTLAQCVAPTGELFVLWLVGALLFGWICRRLLLPRSAAQSA